MNIILIGPPGTGKGTQAEFLVKEFQLRHFIMGEVLRKQGNAQTVLGRKIKQIMDAGGLLSDDIVNEAARAELEDTGFSNVILDGIPRTAGQAAYIEELFAKHDAVINHVLLLELDDDKAIKRIKTRQKTYPREDSASEDVMRNRLKEYKLKTEKLIPFYEERKILRRIDSSPSKQDVFELIIKAIA